MQQPVRLQITGDRHRLTENVSTLAAVARANGIPFWGIVLLVEHWKFRPVTEGMLRWQIAEWLAWGATGIGYFTYWTPPSVPEYEWGLAMIEWNSGRRTPYYQLVSALNARLLTLGEFMAGLRWQSTQHAGSQPVGGVPFAPDSVLLGVDGRATVGRFADARGARYAFVANADSLAQRTITLALAPGWSGIGLRDDGSAWDPLAIGPDGRLWLTLAAGDFVLVRLVAPGQTVAVGSPATRAAPSLRVAPNPARGVVRFTIEGATGPARLDVLDLAGRRLWSRSLASGTREATWSGEGAGGSGVYFARLSDARGAVVRRVAWLGTRTAAP